MTETAIKQTEILSLNMEELSAALIKEIMAQHGISEGDEETIEFKNTIEKLESFLQNMFAVELISSVKDELISSLENEADKKALEEDYVIFMKTRSLGESLSTLIKNISQEDLVMRREKAKEEVTLFAKVHLGLES